MDNFATLAVNYLVMATVFGLFLYLGARVAKIDGANYGLCALISLGAGMIALVSAFLSSQFGLAGQIATGLVFLGLVFYLVVRIFNTSWSKAALSLLVGASIPGLISLVIKLTAGSS